MRCENMIRELLRKIRGKWRYAGDKTGVLSEEAYSKSKENQVLLEEINKWSVDALKLEKSLQSQKNQNEALRTAIGEISK